MGRDATGDWWDRAGGYDPDERLVVPFWLVLTAANLARAASKLSGDKRAGVEVTLASAARCGDPRNWPHEAYPARLSDDEYLARYWRDVGDELGRCLPDQFGTRGG